MDEIKPPWLVYCRFRSHMKLNKDLHPTLRILALLMVMALVGEHKNFSKEKLCVTLSEIQFILP